jgi:ribosome-associated protein|uniref:S4 domain-containing protein YaaA n=1 Tax=Dictyoglomus turgidum TaxID=513050 RepID=A0A7C3SNH4_9BACT
MKEIKIYTDTITLGQFLKWAKIVDTGGQAKNLVLSGMVKVNGEIELHRGRKLKKGDVVEVGGEKYLVIGDD